MGAIVKVDGLQGLRHNLQNLRKKYLGSRAAPVKANVVYTAPYAMYVHENMEMKLRGQPRPSGLGNYWDAQRGPGQSKFLEQPARENRKQIFKIIAKVTKKTDDLEAGIKAGAEYLLAESLKLVPYEHGTLYESGKVIVK